MEVLTIPVGDFGVNCYLVSENGRGFVVDPGDDGERVLEETQKHGITPEAILLTHGHFDHIGGVETLRRQGIPCVIGADDAAQLSDETLSGASFFGLPLSSTAADKTVTDGETLTVAGLTLRVIGTPGHTPGGVCYLLEDILFSGDTLFAGSIGRWDLPGGNGEQLLKSIREKLLILPEKTRVLPGHGGETTIGNEKKYNYFVRER